MADRGLRPVLQPVLYLGLAFLLHALLFLVPMGVPGRSDDRTTRGVRVTVYSDRPAAYSPDPPKVTPRPPAQIDPNVPRTTADVQHSMPGAVERTGSQDGTDSGAVNGMPSGAGYPTGTEGGGGDSPPQSDYSRYLSRLRSEDVQGWARQTARSGKQGWKGTGVQGWGEGVGGGAGTGSGNGRGEGSTKGTAGKYLDPRVRMVVTSYPPTGIESRYTAISYPDLRIKKHQYATGWWNVYLQIRTGPDGNVVRTDVLRPETDGTLEKLFIRQVMDEVERWKFDPVAAEIHVDVRFYVE